ncbi:MAG TPA: SPFH domain-containing protein [Elusimicrobiota bacterium]|jgi:membrane protease subunit (stomatin/prohibitin family)|nr:SPFH domain-containing protein [Elusimicrobiota bacterium]
MAIIDRVKYDGPTNVLVWRYPPDDLSWGTQVIVNQTQEAIFLKGGAVLDVLGPGTHTLRTANIPLLRKMISAPFGGETPFAAEVYFVNKAVDLDVKWGTNNPIPVLDPKFNVFLPVRAFGQFGIQVADSRSFVTQISAQSAEFTADQLSNYFRGILLTKAKDYIAETIVKKKINLLEISAYLEDMSSGIGEKLTAEFAKFGIKLVNFYLNSVDVPEDDETVIRLKKALADRAELDILGDKYQQKRTLDVMEKAAGNEGGGAGLGMGAGMGLGAGMGMGQMMGGMMGQMNPNAPAQPQAAAAAAASAGPVGAKFCSACGKPLAPGAKFCAECGAKLG